jgi:hypothetical protein
VDYIVNQIGEKGALMNELKSHQLARLAYIVAALFTVHLITYLIPSTRDATPSSSAIVAVLVGILGVAEHLLLFPIVAALPAPRWARAAGYGWLVIDMATDIMQLNGIDKSIYLSLRYGGHISAALWIASASWQARWALRVVGWLLALDLFIYSFIAFIPFTFVVLFPSLVLLPVWFVLVGRLLARGSEQRQIYTEKKVMG